MSHDSLSCLLFTAAIEPPQRLSQRDNKLLGFRDNKDEVYEASIFADDTVVFVTHISRRTAKVELRVVNESVRGSAKR